MIIDLNLEEPRWRALSLAQLGDDAILTTLSHLGIDADNCEINLLGCDDTRIGALNAEFRGRDSPTNVLSWPTCDLAAQTEGGLPELPVVDFTGKLALGDIAIAWETCDKEARAADKPLADHVTHLLVHGVLHLLGFDHIRDLDATLMIKNEVEILGKLGIDNPY